MRVNGWLGILLFVVGYNTIAAIRGRKMLSEIADDHVWFTRVIGGLVFAHVGNLLPERLDVVHHLFLRVKRLVHP